MATSRKTNSKSGKGTALQSKSNAALAVDQSTAEPVEELKSDLLDDFLFNAANYMYVRRKLFITLAVVGLMIMVSVYGIFRFLQYQDTVRNEKIFAIEQLINDVTLPAEDRLKKALPELDLFIQENEGTTQHILALFYRSTLRYQEGHIAAAETDLNTVLSTVKPGSELFVLASLHLANLLRDQDKADQAVSVLEAAKTVHLTDIILMELADIYIGTGQNDKAKQTLEVLLQDYPKSFYQARAKQLLEML